MPMATLDGAEAVVCGATSGLGLEIARGIAARHAKKVWLLARDAARAECAREMLAKEFPKVEFLVHLIDMAVDSQVAAFSSLVADVDLVVQAVGASDRGTLADLTPERYEYLHRTNVLPALTAVRHLVGSLQQRKGSLVLIGSLASKFAPRYLGGYAVVKHSVAAVAQQARLENEASGVHVMLVCPGPISRPDAGSRYKEMARESGVPAEALAPGGGAKIKGLDPERLVGDILNSVLAGKREIIRPRKARLLAILAAISPRLGDWILRKQSS